MPRNTLANQLSEYRRKRDFTKTSEPDHRSEKPKRQLVIQQHFASRLHFDLRLEIDGVLVSWAVTRGPSANPKDKRLAVRTEDHPLSYGNFEGTIPKGQYGGGTVILWEYTTYRPLNGDPDDALRNGEIKFESLGQRFRGRWVLVRMKTKERGENWLLIKEKDEFVETDDSLAQRFSSGVLSGLSREDLDAGRTKKQLAKSQSLKQAKLPSFIAPQLCETADIIPQGKDWAFEMKYDGYRLLLAIADGKCAAFTRSGLDWSSKFSAIIADGARLATRSALLDGEAVVLDDKGLSDFPKLVSALEKKSAAKVSFVAFDLLSLDGLDQRAKTYLQRKATLKKLLRKSVGSISYGEFFLGGGDKLFQKIIAAGGEGVIAKRSHAPYKSGRSSDWLKIKGDLREDFNIVGFMPSQKGETFASLLAAREVNGELVYVGRVGTGYNRPQRQKLEPLLAHRRAVAPTLTNAPKLPRGAQFISKPFAAEIRFGGWTSDRQLRQARFIAVQSDREVTPVKKRKITKVAEAPAKTLALWHVTHEDRVQFPDCGVTKGEVAAYYKKIWPHIAPHLRRRPLSLLRVPDNIKADVFFQRHPLKGMERGIEVFGERDEQYFCLEGEEGLAIAVQFGGIEFHGWNAILPDLDFPDRMVFDLDPDEKLPFNSVKAAAEIIKQYLEAAGLKSWPLLSGGKGIHVVVPIDKSASSNDVEFFCEAFAKQIAQERPQDFVATISKARREGRILIDYLRNRNKATAILPWSLRARDGAPMAAPLDWAGLSKAKTAQEFTIRQPLTRDHWKDFWTCEQSLSSRVVKMLRVKQ